MFTGTPLKYLETNKIIKYNITGLKDCVKVPGKKKKVVVFCARLLQGVKLGI